MVLDLKNMECTLKSQHAYIKALKIGARKCLMTSWLGKLAQFVRILVQKARDKMMNKMASESPLGFNFFLCHVFFSAEFDKRGFEALISLVFELYAQIPRNFQANMATRRHDRREFGEV